MGVDQCLVANSKLTEFHGVNLLMRVELFANKFMEGRQASVETPPDLEFATGPQLIPVRPFS